MNEEIVYKIIYSYWRSNFHFVEELNLLDKGESEIWEISDLVNRNEIHSNNKLTQSFTRCKKWLETNHPELFL